MVKEAIVDFKELKAWFREWASLKRLSIRMSLAIRMADIKQKAFNRQYHIMILVTPKGEKLVSVSRDDIERFKRLKYIPKKTNFFDLRHSPSVFYSTPVGRNNKSTREEREKAKEKYYAYSGFK